MFLRYTPPMVDAKGRFLTWTGKIGGPPIGYLARFRAVLAANE